MIPEPAEEAELLHRAARFERHAGFYGIPAAALDQVFTWLGSAYRLSGCAARRCKFPFTAERVSDGKLVKFPCKVVRAAFLAKSEALDVERLITALIPGGTAMSGTGRCDDLSPTPPPYPARTCPAPVSSSASLRPGQIPE